MYNNLLKKWLSHTKIVVTFLACVFFSYSCKHKQEPPKVEPVNIDLVEAFENKAPLNLSTIASKVDYIQLESKREAILGGGPRIFVSDSFIISSGFRKIDVFDRFTGDYIRQVGKYGQAPDEYSGSRHVEAFNEKTNTIIARGWDYTIEYGIDGKVKRKFKNPYDFQNLTPYDNDIYVGFITNRNGIENRKLVFYDALKEELIKTFPNCQVLPTSRNNLVGVSSYEGWFYHFNDSLSFKEFYNDTLFYVNFNTLIPRYVFNNGKHKSPYRDKEYINYFMTRLFIESKQFLFFEFAYDRRVHVSYYDKQSKQCFISNIEGETESGFINDIDGFVPFTPLSLNSNNELIGYVDAFQILQWFKENPEKAAKLPANLQKLKDINETDNPVVMIAKLKK